MQAAAMRDLPQFTATFPATKRRDLGGDMESMNGLRYVITRMHGTLPTCSWSLLVPQS